MVLKGESREGTALVHGSSDDVVCDIVTTISGGIMTTRLHYSEDVIQYR